MLGLDIGGGKFKIKNFLLSLSDELPLFIAKMFRTVPCTILGPTVYIFNEGKGTKCNGTQISPSSPSFKEN